MPAFKTYNFAVPIPYISIMKWLTDFFHLFLRAFGLQELAQSLKRILSNLILSRGLGLSSAICFFEIGGKTENQVSIPECAVAILWMAIN